MAIEKNKLGKNLAASRIINLTKKTDFLGLGFSISQSDEGPHKIVDIEPGSPAEEAGLKQNDLIIKINNQDVVGQRYHRMAAMLKTESQIGHLKIEVIDPDLCPRYLKRIVYV